MAFEGLPTRHRAGFARDALCDVQSRSKLSVLIASRYSTVRLRQVCLLWLVYVVSAVICVPQADARKFRPGIAVAFSVHEALLSC